MLSSSVLVGRSPPDLGSRRLSTEYRTKPKSPYEEGSLCVKGRLGVFWICDDSGHLSMVEITRLGPCLFVGSLSFRKGTRPSPDHQDPESDDPRPHSTDRSLYGRRTVPSLEEGQFVPLGPRAQ